MDVGESVLSAGRAVLELVEREWQPLSASELEQRLDQAVEDILEADLTAKLDTHPAPTTVYVQLLQSQAKAESHAGTTGPCVEEAAGYQGHQGQLSSAAVKYISDLLQSSKSRARMAGRARLSLSQTVLLSLSLLSERVSYRSVSRRFQLEKGNIHRIFFSFCERIGTLKETQIGWPVGREAEDALFPFSTLLGKDDQKEEQGIPRVLGVLGHTRIPIRLHQGKHDVESAVPETKRLKETRPDSWLNLELVCTRSGKFIHCRISQDTDLERGRALQDRLKQHPEVMPSGSCLVARAGYRLTAQVLTPYLTSDEPKQELFNKTLEEHCQILDQAVGNLKARFQRLRYLDIGNYERARAVVLTACVLHNVFVDIGQVIQGDCEKEEAFTQEGEVDDESMHRRDVIANLMFANVESCNS
ncbi:uncharacterized protein LOC133421687 [Cololabis saira]|uniref:uncharacterized protein LOC133421687 n=1 Tax=Cololabis saira TaxID=129043 RepID=UPI002AD290DB|nr:uncharacterized protein LOC133421687 [Cololabis saira]